MYDGRKLRVSFPQLRMPGTVLLVRRTFFTHPAHPAIDMASPMRLA